jgi:nucleoid-associated protein YgaU
MTDERDDIDTVEDEDVLIPTADELRQLSPLAWAQYGAQSIAYARPVVVNGQSAVAIHAADGTPIGAAPTVALATAAILQHGMGAALVH